MESRHGRGAAAPSASLASRIRKIPAIARISKNQLRHDARSIQGNLSDRMVPSLHRSSRGADLCCPLFHFLFQEDHLMERNRLVRGDGIPVPRASHHGLDYGRVGPGGPAFSESLFADRPPFPCLDPDRALIMDGLRPSVWFLRQESKMVYRQ